MKLDEIISEAFDSNVSGKVIKATNGLFVTKATIGDRDIKFTAAGDAGDWEIDFAEHSSSRGATYGKSGSGHELQVFSFVIESLKLFISQYSPDSIFFTSEKSDKNRTSLYTRLLNKLKIPGYRVVIDTENRQFYDVFRIIRDESLK